MPNPAEYEAEIREVASRFAVKHPIHSNYFMLQFYLDHDRDFKTGGVAIERYFESGRESALRFDELVSRFVNPFEAPLDVLEFASGYGCVSRHFNAMKDKYNILACDIHQKAVDFLRDELGVESTISNNIPEKLSFDREFPVIFALSFFSHMPDATWGRWLTKLIDLLSDKGILIFTTHGAKTARDWRGDVAISGYT